MTQTNITKKISTGILFALIATTMVFAANAGNRKGNGSGMGRGDRGMFMLHKLNLTDAQKSKVDALADKERKEVDKIRAEMDKVRDDIQAQWEKEKVDTGKVKSLHKKMQSLSTQIADARLNFRLGVYDVLTPEQRKVAAAELKAMHDGRNARREARGNGNYGNDGRGNGRGQGHGRGPGRGFGPGNGPMW